MPKKPLKKKPLFVHMGNVGDKIKHYEGKKTPKKITLEMEKTMRYAKRFPKAEFAGIDIKRFQKPLPKNVKQIEADFKKGLESLEDNSAKVISSERAIGLFGSKSEPNKRKYTEEVIKIAYRKLAKGGKLMIAIEENQGGIVFDALKNSGFKGKVKSRSFAKKEYERTGWTRTAGRAGINLLQIIAKK